MPVSFDAAPPYLPITAIPEPAAAKMRAAHQKAANQIERDAARAKKAADELQALRAKVARLEKLAAADAADDEILSAMKAGAAADAVQM